MKNILSFVIFLLCFCLSAQITLTHNIGTTPIQTEMFSCERDEGWSRVFKLSDFGILTNEQFIIKSGQVAFSKSYDGAYLQFSVYSIDANFPEFFQSSYPRTLLGTRGMGLSPIINGAPEIIQVDFEEPIIVPAGIDRVLVTVHKIEDFYNPASAQVLIAGTEQDTGVSWYLGCEETYSLTPTTGLTTPVPNANFYINVTGEVFDVKSSGSTTRLSHNVCDDIIETEIHSCTSSYIYWARAFTLEDFGISTNEEFVINSGQVGINKTGWLPEISFNIYKIDDNFPTSFSETDLIGSSQYQQLSPNIDRASQIIQVDFDTPIVIPADVERILVEVHKGIVYGDGIAFIAGSTQSNDKSWQRGCTNVAGSATYGVNEYVSTADFGKPEANFYINVTGNVNHTTNNFEMNVSNICSEFLKEFSIENKSDVASIVWNFGDPASAADNTSIDLSPFHDFSADGEYTITANVTANNGSIEVLTETIDVKEPPNAYGINNIQVCEDSFGTGFSSTFNTSNIQSQVLGSQTGRIVTYIDESGNEYDLLPNPFTNTVKDRETITVRVARSEELCCYSEITFDLIVNPLPDLSNIEDLVECDDDSDGFSTFNLTQIQLDLSTNNKTVDFYFEDGQQINNSQINAVPNKVQYEEIITAKVINTLTNCYNETNFKLIVNPLPIAYALTGLIGCDDNDDGISEYFDTANVEGTVLGNQNGMIVTYYNSLGNPLNLTNPFTNSTPNQEIIIVRVTSQQTNCYTETPLVLNTSSKPQINQLQDIYACNSGDGFSTFNLASVENRIIGNQNNLNVYYFDDSGVDISGLITSSFQNTEPWLQTINVIVENLSSNLCVSETNFKLIVNELPEVDLESEYFLCNLEPSLPIRVNDNFDSYEWKFENGDIISNSYEATLVDSGSYLLKVTEIKNGIACENIYNFKLIRSVLPKIDNVEFQELSDSNYIKINASGDGDFQYSINGNIYQSSNTFNNILGGVYTVYVRDEHGCGKDSRKITIIDYPKYFTPNNDGENDNWQIKGVTNYPNAIITIYNRYGKLLKQINANSSGWDGTFGGEKMPNSDYWFIVTLNEEKSFTGHFALKR